MSRLEDSRVADIMRIVEKLIDARFPDPAGIYNILEKLGTALDPMSPSEANAVRDFMAALCAHVTPRLLNVMHAEALEQECINAELDSSPYRTAGAA